MSERLLSGEPRRSMAACPEPPPKRVPRRLIRRHRLPTCWPNVGHRATAGRHSPFATAKEDVRALAPFVVGRFARGR